MNKVLLGIIGVTAFAMTSGANAMLSISISDSASGQSFTVDDNTTSDEESKLGEIVTLIDTTNYNGTVTSGVGSEVLAFPNIMDLAAQGNFLGDTTMTFSISENGLSGFDSAQIQASLNTIHSITGGWTLYGGNSNTLYDTTNTLATGGLNETSGFADFSTLIPANGDFSLTLVGTFTGSNGDFISVDTLAVPEPSVLALFGLGLLGMGAVARKRKQS